MQVRFSEDLGDVYKIRIGFANDNDEEQNWLLDSVRFIHVLVVLSLRKVACAVWRELQLHCYCSGRCLLFHCCKNCTGLPVLKVWKNRLEYVSVVVGDFHRQVGLCVKTDVGHPYDMLRYSVCTNRCSTLSVETVN